jgi:cell pole-organizing protein PopZ
LGEDARAAKIAPNQAWGDESTAPCHPADAAPLLSPHTTAAVDTAFDSLTHTMLSQNPRTLEDLVCEMLKPMLKSWLDANLPDMVERLVRAEIERVSRGPRRR